MADRRPLSIGHSPDADDAFMFYALAHEHITIPGREIQHVMEDLESLNNRAVTGDLDVTAISAAQYPQIADKYRIMACGASIGRNYGPVVVSRTEMSPVDLAGKKIGVPGEFTTSYMLLQIFVDVPFTPVFLEFGQVGGALDDGSVDAGILLHEEQILYERQGHHKILDLGVEWFSSTNLPIPLGLDCIHRRMGEAEQAVVTRALHDAIVYARTNEDDALEYAMQYGRGMEKGDIRKYLRMYVNQDTVDMGDEGRRALEQLFGMAAERGIIAEVPRIDLVPVS